MLVVKDFFVAVRRPVRCLLLVTVAAARVGFAQPPQFVARAGGTISGSVLDAATEAPLARARVTLTPEDRSEPRDASSPRRKSKTVTTSEAGAYHFTDLSTGAYRVDVQRIGYGPVAVDVWLGETGRSPVSIGLVVLPVRLRAVEVHATGGGSSTNHRDAMGDDARVAAARARQRAFLATDARELTAADMAESATLGGPDVLRALQHVAGATQFDDWSAKLWVRGNRWDHNRVYYDDLPLFDPLGALGRTSGLSAEAVGEAFLLPGVRPVSLGGEGATRIDLRSHPATGSGDFHGSAQVSQFGASAAVEHERENGTAGFALSAHHTLGEWLPPKSFLSAFADRAVSDAQVTVRGDADLGGGRRIETSGLYDRDARRSPIGSGADRVEQDWGNAAGRVTFRASLGPLATVHTAGISHFASSSARYFAQAAMGTATEAGSLTVSPVISSVDYVTFGGRLAPNDSKRAGSTAGYDVTIQRSSLAGPRQSVYWGDLSLEHVARRDKLDYASVWGEDRRALGSRVEIESGLRLDVGGGSTLDPVRPAGSAQARLLLAPLTWLSIGASRTHQYVQGIDLPVVAAGQTIPTLWLTAGGDVPMMRVDHATVGVERWASPGVLLGANAYARHTGGAITTDPTPGPLVERPLFVGATESATGVELSVRKLTGRTTGQLAYSYGHATMDARGFSFPAPASRTHALDAAMTIRFGSFDVGGGYMLTSGAPFTRTVFGSASADPSSHGVSPAMERETPNAQRLPSYASLDLSLDYERTFHAASLIGFAGIQNVLGRKNSTWYELSGACGVDQPQAASAPDCHDRDVLQAPVTFAPTVGLRVVFQ